LDAEEYLVKLSVRGGATDPPLYGKTGMRDCSGIPVFLDHPPVNLRQSAAPKELSKVSREHPVISLTIY
jgi:hypothetical protein